MADPLTRLALLERAVAGLIAGKGKPRRSEALQPTYLTVTSAGVTNADFTGHVHAQGLDLDAATSSTPPANDKVRWLRTSDGALVADVFGYSAGGAETIGARSHALAPADTSQAFLDVVDDVGTEQGNIAVSQTNRGAAASVIVTAAGHSITLVNQLGAADFLKLTTGSTSAFWCGAVAGAGGTVRLNGTFNWTVVRTAVGTYTLTLTGGPTGVWAIATCQTNEAFGSQPAVDVTYTSQVGGTTTLTVKTISDPLGLTDLNWSFHAVATQN